MSEYKIKLEAISKKYNLYKNTKEKALDLLGFYKYFFWKKKEFREFWAIKNLDLEIKEGERIGIVGRNGAGKSTLLKIISGNIKPTSGSLKVAGNVQALMELGTGFHPEFTGRENIRSALSYQGFKSSEIKIMEEEIIDFAELGEFIDQPLKTYSAGMYARLAFSSSTAVKPDILIIDEILGAGDAYFTSKSVDRMKRLAKDTGATVLFVSHDMSSVEMLCDRCVWIERGRLKMDGPASEVSKAYAEMIREMENNRIKAKNSITAKAHTGKLRKLTDSPIPFVIRFKQLTGSKKVHINSVKLDIPDEFNNTIVVGDAQDQSTDAIGFVHIDGVMSDWGNPREITVTKLSSRQISVSSLPSAVVYNVNGFTKSKGVELSVDWYSQDIENTEFEIESFDGEYYKIIGSISNKTSKLLDNGLYRFNFQVPQHHVEKLLRKNGIIASDIELSEEEKEKLLEAQEKKAHGEIYDGSVHIKNVIFRDKEGVERGHFESFDSFFVDIYYETLKENLEFEVGITFYMMGMVVHQSVSGLQEGGRFIIKEKEEGKVTFQIPNLTMGAGKYLVSVGIFPFIDYNHLASEKNAYVLHDRRYQIEITQPEKILIPLGLSRSNVIWTFEH